MFDQPQVTITGGVVNVVETETPSLSTEVEVHQVRPGQFRCGLMLSNVITIHYGSVLMSFILLIRIVE